MLIVVWACYLCAGLAAESLKCGEAVETLERPSGALQPLLGHGVHGQQVGADADGGLAAPRALLRLRVALVVAGVLVAAQLRVRVVAQVRAAVPRALGLVLRHAAPRRLKYFCIKIFLKAIIMLAC